MTIGMRSRIAVTACFLPVALGACGGGGGGSGTRQAAPVPLVYPPVTGAVSLTGQSVHVGIDNAKLSSTQLNGSVVGHVDWAADRPTAVALEFTVPAAALKVSENFDALSQRPIDIAPGYQVIVSSQEKTASDGSRRSLLLLSPDSAGLRYTTLGVWGYAQPGSPAQYDGRFVLGTPTRLRDIPVTGSASYAGLMLGTLADGTAIYDVSAFANAVADFAARSVSMSTSLSTRTARGPGNPIVADPGLDLSGTLVYPADSNNLSGKLTSASGELSGQANARFYGPAVHELGGTYFVEKSDKSKQMSGAFSVRR
jgi:hypothetical protein